MTSLLKFKPSSKKLIFATSLLFALACLVASTFVVSCCDCAGTDACYNFEDEGYQDPRSFSSCCGAKIDYCDDNSIPAIEPPDSISYGTLTYEGKDYKTVEIGTQTWMAENLNREVSWSICYYNLESNCDIYGRLYTWDAAMKVCPEGWRLPSGNDWRILNSTVGGSEIARLALRATSGWEENRNGTDDFGFSALPSGCGYNRSVDGVSGIVFSGINYWSHWWSSSDHGNGKAYYREMDKYGYGGDVDIKEQVFSVRCIKNE